MGVEKYILQITNIMKTIKLTTLFLSLCAVSFGQCSCIDTIVDKFDGYKSIIAKNKILLIEDKKGMGIILWQSDNRNKKSITMQVLSVGNGRCMNSTASIDILFVDGTNATIWSLDHPNCMGEYFILSGISDNVKAFELMKTKKISSLRANSMTGQIERNVPDDLATELMNDIICLSK